MEKQSKRFSDILRELRTVLCYQGLDLQLNSYNDADWGNDLDKHKLTVGYVFFIE